MQPDRPRPTRTALTNKTDLNRITDIEILKAGARIRGRGNLGKIGNQKSLLGAILAVHLNRARLRWIDRPQFPRAGFRPKETRKVSHQRQGRCKDGSADH